MDDDLGVPLFFRKPPYVFKKRSKGEASGQLDGVSLPERGDDFVYTSRQFESDELHWVTMGNEWQGSILGQN